MNWGWDKVLDVNVKAPFFLTRAMKPLLSLNPMQGTQDNPARVINVGSIAGMVPQNVPTHAYDVSKAALHHLTKKLAGELVVPAYKGARAITVNAIAPGYVRTRVRSETNVCRECVVYLLIPLSLSAAQMSEGLSTWGADGEALASSVPLGRCGEAHDMVGVVIYLASPASAWVTGVVIPVDGGTTGAACIPVVPD